MIKVNYEGDLKKDIENSKKQFNRKKEILKRFISFTLCTLLGPVFMMIPYSFDIEAIKNNLNYIISSFACVSLVCQTYFYKRDKRKINKEYNNANFRLAQLVEILGVNDIVVEKKNIQDSIIKEHKEKVTKEINNIKNSTETITRQFYFLDREEKIRALKSIRKVLKEGRNVTSDETSLYCIEEDLTNQEFIPVKLVKCLKRNI